MDSTTCDEKIAKAHESRGIIGTNACANLGRSLPPLSLLLPVEGPVKIKFFVATRGCAMVEQKPKWNEDWLALWIGLAIFVVSLGMLAGVDLLGWVVKTKPWVEPSQALTPLSNDYAAWLAQVPLISPGALALLATYVFLLAVSTLGAVALRVKIGEFVRGFSLVFWISYLCWVLGSYTHIAGKPLNLTQEAGFIVALIAGLVIGNFFPRLAWAMQAAVRPEWYIKTGIVLLGGAAGAAAATQFGLATSVMFRGLCAIVEAYLIYWAVVYYVARRFFKFPREWAVPLASGISICGVSAAVATGAAIKARPVVPIMVSSLVVIFAVVELLVLPFAAQKFLYKEPMVAGAWMGLAVKSDGAAIASGAITESLIYTKAKDEDGVTYNKDEHWVMNAATTVKMFIDVFIGVWAFILAVIWCTVIEKTPGEKVSVMQIWERFPKFVIGYMLTFLTILLLAWHWPDIVSAKNNVARVAMDEGGALRSIFFVMTFFTIGVMSNFKKLWQEGIGKLAAVYVVCLFGFIIWIGLAISWIFFHGVKPPIIGG
jgi:uncharacterized membrane protein YadS